MKKGHRQGKTQGDPLQQGGVCVIDTNGAVLFAHRDQTAGDHLNVETLLSNLKSNQRAIGFKMIQSKLVQPTRTGPAW